MLIERERERDKERQRETVRYIYYIIGSQTEREGQKDICDRETDVTERERERYIKRHRQTPQLSQQI